MGPLGSRLQNAPILLMSAVAKFWLGTGAALGQLGHPRDAMTVCDDVVRVFGRWQQPSLAELVATALSWKAFTLGQLGHFRDEIAVYDDVLRRFGDHPEPALAEPVATALVGKGMTLIASGKPEEARPSLQEVLKRLEGATDPALQKLVELARKLLDCPGQPPGTTA